ncbi:4194_t:CDS:1, partial [Gigaspora margarita]
MEQFDNSYESKNEVIDTITYEAINIPTFKANKTVTYEVIDYDI